MPTVAIAEGANILMYANDHAPPHFHVLFAEHRAVIDIETLKLSRGELPKAKLNAIVKWATPRRSELFQAWQVTQSQLIPERIR
jgi:hypothetical protein